MASQIFDSITALTRLNHTNPLNAVQLWRGNYQRNFQGQSETIPILIKQLTTDYQPIHLNQLKREAKALKACQTLALLSTMPNTSGLPVLVDDSFQPNQFKQQDGVNPYLIMHYYQGQTLKDFIVQNSLTLAQKISLTIKLCQLIQRLHNLGYLHGDIKPANILITHQQQIVLLDFALAQSINSPISQTSLITAGTPAYMCPEQFTGQVLTHKSDYYSIGVTLYELVYGHLPFSCANLQGYALAHCQQPVPLSTHYSADNYNQHIAITLNALLTKLLAKLPQNRVDSLEYVISQLNAINTAKTLDRR